MDVLHFCFRFRRFPDFPFILSQCSGKAIRLLIIGLGLLPGLAGFFPEVQAQSPPPRLKKFEMGKSGCFLHFPEETLEVNSDTLDDAIVYTASARLDKHAFRAEIIRLNQPVFAPDPVIDPENPDSVPPPLPAPADSLAMMWREKWLTRRAWTANGDSVSAPHPAIRETNGWTETWSSADGKTQAVVQIWAHPAAIVFLEISGKTLFEDAIVQGIFFRNIVLPKVYRE